MAYQARRDDNYDASQSYSEQKKAENERHSRNNANTIKNAANVAEASGEPHAAAIGKAVNVADKLTGGKSTEALGKAMTRANKINPVGKQMQRASDKLAESGIGDKVGQAASLKNGEAGSAKKPLQNDDIASKVKKPEGNGSLDKSNQPDGAIDKTKQPGEMPGRTNNASQMGDRSLKESKKGGQESSPSSSETESKEQKRGSGFFMVRSVVVMVALTILPFLFLVVLVFSIISNVTVLFDDYDDAFGMSSVLGEETGGVDYESASKEQEEMLNRINDVKLEYQAQGKTFDAMKIVAVYHTLVSEKVDIDYDDVSKTVIRKWADAMFVNNYYSDETFKNNLINNIFPSYKPGENVGYYQDMADEVFNYLERYYDLIGREMLNSSCASIGNCAYDIKGFNIPGQGNYIKNMQISNLKVRLMECGSPYGNGNYNKPIDQDLVNFEDYVAGVAYAEVGDYAYEETLKAQMVAARSYALARPTAVGNSLGKKLSQENGQWILQISSCVADQVFCNIDLGCSFMGGGDGQGGICRSGKVAGAVKTRAPIPQDHALRRAAAATQGEVLVDSKGYVISAGYLDTDQRKWEQLAKQGMNYKQILLQSYNSGNRNYGAANIEKAACGNSDNGVCISTGDFSKWRQTDPQWSSTPMGSSGKSLGQIGCLVTSVSMLIAKSGVPVNVNPLNPGTLVEYLNTHGGFDGGGNFMWASVSQVAPSFRYQDRIYVSGMSREEKLNRIKNIISQPGVYAVAEVKGNTGQHWVAIDSVTGSTVNMMDPSSNSTDMWSQYNWANTSTIAYYKVG